MVFIYSSWIYSSVFCIQSSVLNNAPSIEEKTSLEEGEDVYLASSSTHADHESWLVDSSTSFHMTLHSEWFYEYESSDGSDVFLGDESTSKIIG